MGFSERTDAVVEPRLSLQRFLKMKEMAALAPEVVNDGTGEVLAAQVRSILTATGWKT